MRKNLIFSLIATVCVIMLSFACVKVDTDKNEAAAKSEAKVITVAQKNEVDDVQNARFLNMLNHNFVYNDAFYDDIDLVNDSMIALLDTAEEGYLSEAYLTDYIFNMYGKIYNDLSFLGDGICEDGMVYIIPRGYAVYDHTVLSVTDNKDGSFTVITEVAISAEDGNTEIAECETVFLQNEESAFGYNIMYSIISEGLIGNSDC